MIGYFDETQNAFITHWIKMGYHIDIIKRRDTALHLATTDLVQSGILEKVKKNV